MVQKRPCVYILASRRNGTLYIGVTSNLVVRIHQHRSNAVAGFVQDYGVHRLVFAEFHDTMEAAILREKRLKKWRPLQARGSGQLKSGDDASRLYMDWNTTEFELAKLSPAPPQG